MSPQEVVAIHREMTQEYNPSAMLEKAAASWLLSLFVVIAVLLFAAGIQKHRDSGWAETVVEMGYPFREMFPGHTASH